MHYTPPADGRTQSQALAAFALHFEASRIPDTVREGARDHFLDTLGVALASSTFGFGDAVLAGARELGSGGDALAIGSGALLPAASAALVNGTLAHGLDYDDTHIGAIYHASAPALAAALATGQAVHASGTDVLDAYLIAMEIGCRLAGAAPGEFHARGLHPTAQCGVFAAAAASARLRRSEPGELVSAFGLAGSQASGILEIGRSWLKRLHPGWAAHAGLIADSSVVPDFSDRTRFSRGHMASMPHTLDTSPKLSVCPLTDLAKSGMRPISRSSRIPVATLFTRSSTQPWHCATTWQSRTSSVSTAC
jgi:2-methylcitrate dehydratase PrpD